MNLSASSESPRFLNKFSQKVISLEESPQPQKLRKFSDKLLNLAILAVMFLMRPLLEGKRWSFLIMPYVWRLSRSFPNDSYYLLWVPKVIVPLNGCVVSLCFVLSLLSSMSILHATSFICIYEIKKIPIVCEALFVKSSKILL